MEKDYEIWEKEKNLVLHLLDRMRYFKGLKQLHIN